MRPAVQLLVLTIGQGLAVGIVTALAFLVSSTPLSHAHMLILSLMALLSALAGGIASFFHMHHMQAARYILRRLKTSWLSREALTTGLFGAILGVLTLWTLFSLPTGAPYTVLLWVGVFIGLIAMFVTAMLYATIPAMISWHSPMTVVSLMVVGILSGTEWALLLAPPGAVAGRSLGIAIGVLILVAIIAKGLHWHHFRDARGRIRAATGTGLPFAPYRLQDTGTTKPPYRTQTQVWPPLSEHVRRRMMIMTVLFLGVIPEGAVIGWALSGMMGWAWVVAISGFIGTVCERWLFFGDATHSSRVFFADEPSVPSRVATPVKISLSRGGSSERRFEG